METRLKKLRDLGLSATPQRLAVLGVIESRRDHPTAEQIYGEVRRQLPSISFNTVYKTLEVLCQKGLIIKVNPLHEVARYDGQAHHHAHLICRSCHRIFDVERQLPTLPLPKSEVPPGFQVESQAVIFWGTCPQCPKTKVS